MESLTQESESPSADDALKNLKQEEDDKLETNVSNEDATTTVTNDHPKCSICLGRSFNDESTIDQCTHRFCFGCIMQWCVTCMARKENSFCPMCKAPVKMITHELNSNPPTKMSVETLRPLEPHAHDAAQDNAFERRIFNFKCRQLRSDISFLNHEIERLSKVKGRANETFSKLEVAKRSKQDVVSQLNCLQMLKDDLNSGVPKGAIVSRVEFRRLIYSEDLIMNCSEWNPHIELGFTPEQCTAHRERYEQQLIPWIVDELKAIPLANPGTTSKLDRAFLSAHEALGNQVQSVAQDVFNLMLTLPLTSTQFAHTMSDKISIRRRHARKFGEQLMAFASSGEHSFLAFCQTVTYKLVESAPPPQYGRRHFGPNPRSRNIPAANTSVVVLSDEDDHPEDVVEIDRPRALTDRNARHYDLRPINNRVQSISPFTLSNLVPNFGLGANPSVLNSLFNRNYLDMFASRQFPMQVSSNTSGSATTSNALAQPESNYLGEPRNWSDSDDDSDMYARETLRIPDSVPRGEQGSSAGGTSNSALNWGDLTSDMLSNSVGAMGNSGQQSNRLEEIVTISDDDDVAVVPSRGRDPASRSDSVRRVPTALAAAIARARQLKLGNDVDARERLCRRAKDQDSNSTIVLNDNSVLHNPVQSSDGEDSPDVPDESMNGELNLSLLDEVSERGSISGRENETQPKKEAVAAGSSRIYEEEQSPEGCSSSADHRNSDSGSTSRSKSNRSSKKHHRINELDEELDYCWKRVMKRKDRNWQELAVKFSEWAASCQKEADLVRRKEKESSSNGRHREASHTKDGRSRKRTHESSPPRDNGSGEKVQFGRMRNDERK